MEYKSLPMKWCLRIDCRKLFYFWSKRNTHEIDSIHTKLSSEFRQSTDFFMD